MAGTPPAELERRQALVNEQLPELLAPRHSPEEAARIAYWNAVRRQARSFVADTHYPDLRKALVAVLKPTSHSDPSMQLPNATASEQAVFRMGAGRALEIIDEWAETPEEAEA